MSTRWLPALFALLASCVAPPEPYDYSLYLAHSPRSILVLPPMNESIEVQASHVHLSTISAPLAERGYYVFPVAVVEQLMRENGLPTAWEMHQVSLSKLGEIFGADAVLYLTIEDWGTSYQVIQSTSAVALRGKLVDVDTGLLLWEGRARMEKSSGGGGDPLSLVVSALVTQVGSSISDPSDELSRAASYTLVGLPDHGLLLGPRHPGFEESRRALREEMAARAAADGKQ
jgi:hypothetical protein